MKASGCRVTYLFWFAQDFLSFGSKILFPGQTRALGHPTLSYGSESCLPLNLCGRYYIYTDITPLLFSFSHAGRVHLFCQRLKMADTFQACLLVKCGHVTWGQQDKRVSWEFLGKGFFSIYILISSTPPTPPLLPAFGYCHVRVWCLELLQPSYGCEGTSHSITEGSKEFDNELTLGP